MLGFFNLDLFIRIRSRGWEEQDELGLALVFGFLSLLYWHLVCQ